MGLIIQSFFLSFRVSGHIIIPFILIAIISMIISIPLNLISGGLAQYLLGPGLAVFYSLFGIRIALATMGDRSRPAYDSLILASLVYGVFFGIVQLCLAVMSEIAVLLYAGKTVDLMGLLQDFPNLLSSQDLGADGFKLRIGQVITLVFVWEVVLYAVMAVPMAGVARAAGSGTADARFFDGFGRSFIPLSIVIAISFAVTTVLGLFAAIFGLMPAVLYFIAIVTFQDLPEFDLDGLVNGIGASFAIVFAYAWVCTASALALKKADGVSKRAVRVAAAQSTIAEDMRALRKSRE